MTSNKRVILKLCPFIFPVFLALLFHFPSLFCKFVWDDVNLIVNHQLIGNPGFVKEIFRRDYGLEFTSSPVGYYRPMFMLMNFVIYHAFGPSPVAYHAVGLLLFCCCTVLVVLACRKFLSGRDRRLAIWAACILAVHPVRSEVVSLFMSQPDMMMEILALLFILAVGKAVKSADETGNAGFAGVTLFVVGMSVCLVAGLTKENAFFIFPAMALTVLLRSIVPGGAVLRGRPIALCLGALAGLGLAQWCSMLAGIQRQHPAVQYVQGLFTSGSGRAVRYFVQAVHDIFIPSHSIFMKEIHAGPSLVTGATLVILVIVLAALWWILLVRGRLFYALLAAWFGAGIVSLMLMGTVHLPYSQRYLPAVPSVIGMCLIVRCGWRKLTNLCPRIAARMENRRMVTLAIVAYIAMLGAFTLSASAKCLSPASFFTFMADENPGFLYPRVELVKLMFGPYRDLRKMDDYFNQAVSLAPDSPEVRGLGKLMARRCFAEARYEEAVRWLDWDIEVAGKDDEAFWLRAVCQASMGNRGAASASIEKALRIAPNNATYIDLRRELGDITGPTMELPK